MPILGIHKTDLDFSVIETMDPKTIVIIDKSTYMDKKPQKPKLEILAPGYTQAKIVSYNPYKTTVVNARQLNLTCGNSVNMPDGIYVIKMSICPNEHVYLEKTFLKTDLLEYAIDSKLLETLSCKDLTDKFKRDMETIFILLKSAKAHGANGNINEATKLYSKIEKLVN